MFPHKVPQKEMTWRGFIAHFRCARVFLGGLGMPYLGMKWRAAIELFLILAVLRAVEYISTKQTLDLFSISTANRSAVLTESPADQLCTLLLPLWR